MNFILFLRKISLKIKYRKKKRTQKLVSPSISSIQEEISDFWLVEWETKRRKRKKLIKKLFSKWFIIFIENAAEFIH